MIVAIPDIHGRWDLLKPLMAKVYVEWDFEFNAGHTLLFMGDMVDRGRQSKEVCDFIRDLTIQMPGQVIALKGNHENLCIDAYTSLMHTYGDTDYPIVRQGGMYGRSGWICATPEVALWIQNGGYTTAKSWPEGKVAPEILNWMQELPLFYETEKFFFSHAPVPKEDLRYESKGQPYTEHELTWTYFEDLPEQQWCERPKGKIGVCGHVHQLLRGILAPRFYDHYYFLDAGAGCSDKAPLIACNVETRDVLYEWPDKMKKRMDT